MSRKLGESFKARGFEGIGALGCRVQGLRA